MEKLRQICIIVNPKARKFKENIVSELVQLARRHEIDPLILRTQYRGHAPSLTEEALARNVQAVFALGGDGILNEVVQKLSLSETPLGILPSGTVNVLARDLNIPLHPVAALQMALTSAKTKSVNLGQIHFTDTGISHAFVLMAGIGLDARVCRDVSPKIKKILGPLAYFLETFKALLFKRKNFLLEAQDGSAESFVSVVANSRYYGGSFVLCPEAGLDRDFLDSLSVNTLNPLTLGAVLFGLSRWVRRYRGTEFCVTEKGISVQADGDYLGETPIRVYLGGRLRILVPDVH